CLIRGSAVSGIVGGALDVPVTVKPKATLRPQTGNADHRRQQQRHVHDVAAALVPQKTSEPARFCHVAEFADIHVASPASIAESQHHRPIGTEPPAEPAPDPVMLTFWLVGGG